MREAAPGAKALVWVFLAGLVVAGLAAALQSGPGYMDAEYYTLGGKNLAAGKGMWEPVLWNYLDDPQGLPHPAFAYWMPFASILAAAGMALLKNTGFLAARIGYVVLAGFLPVETAWIAARTLKRPRDWWIAALLATFPGVYIVYLTIPETFLPYLLLGGLFVALAFLVDWRWLGSHTSPQRALLVGITAGLLHLTRADGLLWLAGALAWMLWKCVTGKNTNKLRIASIGMVAVLAGYAAVTSFWYARNLSVFGSLLPPGNSRTMWITAYDQTFSYPASGITFSAWLATGWEAHLKTWWDALKLNLGNLLVVGGDVVLLPLILAGAWVKRKEHFVQFALVMGLITLLVMTFIFPFSGYRGGFLHSNSAIQVVLWVLAVVGIESAAEWLAKGRGLPIDHSMLVFGVAAGMVAFGISVWAYSSRVLDGFSPSDQWVASENAYRQVAGEMQAMGVLEDTVMMVNNPPGFSLVSGYPAVVIPDGDLGNVLEAAERYRAGYLLLEGNQANLNSLYADPHSGAGLEYLGDTDSVQIYRVSP